MKKKKVYLTLQSGEVFQGYRFGADGETVGELVFTTGMVGYVETLTDPANFGQIVVQTFPLIGNYGVNESDAESDRAWLNAYVVREYCDTPSNFRSEGTLDAFMKKKGVIGIYGVDTRELTKILREKGAMNARVSDNPLTAEDVEALANYSVQNAVETVACKQKKIYENENAEYTVAFWDFGSKNSTVENFVRRGCKVIRMPYNATAEEILSLGADGVVLGDGAGDPEENTGIIAEVKKLLGKTPVFGIGLGHQLVALALGGETAKQKYGHRGGNQPVKCQKCNRVYISSQNHGYEVVKDSLQTGTVKFLNVNDGSCEGIDYDEINAFTVQFNPECCDLGNTENPLYKKFFALMKKEKDNA